MELGVSPEECSFEAYVKALRKRSLENLVIKGKRYPPIWLEDSQCLACLNCGYKFSWTVRRHHCRACGKIFCGSCVSKELILPKGIEIYPQEPKDTRYSFFKSANKPAKKVCDKCFSQIMILTSYEKLILPFSYLTLKDWDFVKLVCKPWHLAICILRAKFSEIPLIPPNCQQSDLQKRMLRINKEYITGHAHYTLKLLMLDGSYMEAPKTISCFQLACEQYPCPSAISIHEILQYKAPPITEEFTNLISKIILTLSLKEIEIYLSQIISRSQEWNLKLVDILVSISESLEVRVYVYWCLTMMKSLHNTAHYVNILKNYLSIMCSKYGEELLTNELLYGRKIFKFLASIPLENTIVYLRSKTEDKILRDLKIAIKFAETEIIDETKGNISIPYPFDTSKKIICFNAYSIEVKSSSSSPVLFNFTLSDGHLGSLLLKKDFIYKDYVIINVIKLMDLLLKRDLETDYGIRTYKVFVLSPSTGIIEIIKNAETLGNIKHQHHISILNYLLNNNPNSKVFELREKFIKSTAAYCIITYLLGVGDRHLDNILLTRDGYLIHIDYGFILGSDPKSPMAPLIRITDDVVQAFGGDASEGYEKFKICCVNIYNCLRKYYWLFHSILSQINIQNEEELMKRFLPYETDEKAGPHLLSKIDKSYSIEGVSSVIIDMCHLYAKGYREYFSSSSGTR